MKEHTNNEYNKSINLAIDYINRHLNKNIDLKTISEIAMISEFHFCRIFKAYIGESIGAYTTRIRMERAAHLLQVSDNTLSEIAEKTSYQSQQSLSKAFTKHFGIRPSEFRNSNTYLSPKPFKNQTNKVKLNPQIVELTPKKLVYIRIIAKYGSELDYQTAWKKLISFANSKDLINENSEYIGLSFDNPNITEDSKKPPPKEVALISPHRGRPNSLQIKPQLHSLFFFLLFLLILHISFYHIFI